MPPSGRERAVAALDADQAFCDAVERAMGMYATQRRERPHLILDAASGHITHLINGVQPLPTAGKAPPSAAFQNDYTYTLIQPIQGH